MCMLCVYSKYTSLSLYIYMYTYMLNTYNYMIQQINRQTSEPQDLSKDQYVWV